VPVGRSSKLVEQLSVQQSASTEQLPSGCAQVAFRQVQLEAPGKVSMHPHLFEQQSESIAQLAVTARQGPDRHVPFSQMPVQHWDAFLQRTSAGRHAHRFLRFEMVT
jgi:hypothetical protein